MNIISSAVRSTPSHLLAARVAVWVNGLPHPDPVLWHLLRFEDVVRERPLAHLLPVLTAAQHLRTALQPQLAPEHLAALDTLLTDPLWSDPQACSLHFARIYLADRRFSNRGAPVPWSWQGHAGLTLAARALVLLDAQRSGVSLPKPPPEA